MKRSSIDRRLKNKYSVAHLFNLRQRLPVSVSSHGNSTIFINTFRIAQIDRQVFSPTIIDLRLSEKVDIKQSYNLSIRLPDSKKILIDKLWEMCGAI